MLLTCLQGQDESTAAVVVGGLADDTAGELTGHSLGAGHDAQVGAAEAQGHAQRLAFADSHISAILAGGLQQAQGDGVAAHDSLCAHFVGSCHHSVHVFDDAVVVGALDVNSSGLLVEGCLQSLHIGSTVHSGDDHNGNIAAAAVGLDDLDGLGISSAGDNDGGTLSLLAHENCLSSGHSAVVDGSVGHVHAGQFTDLSLILKDGLQNALADLSLVGGVSSQELFLGSHGLHNGRDIVVVSTCAAEDAAELLVLTGHSSDLLANFQLAHAFGDVQLLKQSLLRHDAVQLVHGGQADGLQHFLPLFPGCGNIAAHIMPPQLRRRLRSPLRPAVPRYR